MTPNKALLPCAVTAAVLLLVACGGGGGSTGTSSGSTSSSSSAVSSGTISAFGSVFVNGHEFSTQSATVVDDDTLGHSASTSGLEVGMAVDVVPAAGAASSPEAGEIHVHPLARGIVDASSTSGSTITVMGQTVQITASTTFADHRACLTSTTAPCSAIVGQAGLTATSGSGTSAVAGNYVTVDGYLFASGTVAAGANIVATLVSVRDVPTGTVGAQYKAEGVVTAASGTTVTIGGLSVDLSAATCFAGGSATTCSGAYHAGQVVSAFAAAEPSLPATTLHAGTALLRDRLVVQTVGASVELEGAVSSVTASPASFVVRGVTVDASALTGTTLPSVGDVVRVDGTIASNGSTVTASSVTVLHAAGAATYGLEGNVGSVSAGSTSGTYVLNLLGQSITVNATTRLADLSVRGGNRGDSAGNPFNINTFQTYLAASASQHLVVRVQSNGSGSLTALSVTIAPASTVASVGGKIDATPAPVNSTTSGTASTFSVDGIAVSADPSAILGLTGQPHSQNPLTPGSGSSSTSTSVTLAAGDKVMVRGTYANGVLTVAADTTAPTAASTNYVFDFGTLSQLDCDFF